MADMIERIEQPQGHIFYRIRSEYAKDTLALEPDELLKLLRFLSEHEDEIVNDTTANRVYHEMIG